MSHLKTLFQTMLPALLLLGACSYKTDKTDVTYKYAVQKTSEAETLEATNQFLQQRLKRNPSSATDQLSLAQNYLEKASLTAEVQYYDLAEKHAKKSLQSRKALNNGATLVLAKVAEARHQFINSIEVAKSVLAKDPQSISAMKILATSYLGFGDSDSAVKFVKMASQKQKSSELSSILAMAEQQRGNEKEAIAAMNEAIELEGPRNYRQSAFSRTFLGQIYLDQKKFDRAEKYFNEALRILPDYHLALASLGDLNLAKQKPEIAIELYSRAFASLGEPPYLIKQANVLSAQNKIEPAKKYYSHAEKLIREEMGNGPYGHHNELALLLLDRGDPKDIREAHTEALKEVRSRPTPESHELLARANASIRRVNREATE